MRSEIFSSLALAAAILVLVLTPAEARAEPPPHVAVRLEYTIDRGAEVCPAESALRSEIARRLGYDPVTPYAAARLVATFARTGRGLAASAQFFDEAGKPGWTRTYRVPDDDCAALVSGMGSEASFMLDPFVLPGTTLAAPPPPAAPPPAAARPPVPPPSSQAPPADRRRSAPPTLAAGSSTNVEELGHVEELDQGAPTRRGSLARRGSSR